MEHQNPKKGVKFKRESEEEGEMREGERERERKGWKIFYKRIWSQSFSECSTRTLERTSRLYKGRAHFRTIQGHSENISL